MDDFFFKKKKKTKPPTAGGEPSEKVGEVKRGESQRTHSVFRSSQGRGEKVPRHQNTHLIKKGLKAFSGTGASRIG